MLAQRLGQMWLYHGGSPLRTLLQPHGFKEHAEPLENLEHDELHRADNKEEPDVEL
jgi:hypothetical protein